MKKVFLILGLCTAAAFGLAELESSVDVRASRNFSGPTQFPPYGFAGYGVLVFPALPSQEPERFLTFCEAYLVSLLSSSARSDLGVSVADQMVTVLPVSSNEVAAELGALGIEDACNGAMIEYDLAQALNALKQANNAAGLTDGLQTLSGRGPFLLA